MPLKIKKIFFFENFKWDFEKIWKSREFLELGWWKEIG